LSKMVETFCGDRADARAARNICLRSLDPLEMLKKQLETEKMWILGHFYACMPKKKLDCPVCFSHPEIFWTRTRKYTPPIHIYTWCLN